MHYPITELKIPGIYISTSDMDSPDDYPSSNAALFPDLQLLSQLFTISDTLSVLDISATSIGPDGAACFADLRNVLIRDLRMEGCDLGPAGADKIGEMLYHNNSIVSIALNGNDIKDNGVEKLVYHLSRNVKLQHLDLGQNEITAVGANHLRRLLANDHPALTSIELSYNPLKDEGVHAILSSLTVTMVHIGLTLVDMTASSYPIIGASLDKTKSISFNQPEEDCEVISDCLASTTVLKQLDLCGNGNFLAGHKMLTAIRQSDNIETLTLFELFIKVIDITKLLEYSKTIRQLTIRSHDLSSLDLQLIAKSLTVSNSLKKFQYYDFNLDQATTLKFLEQLKQAYTVEEITLGVSHKASGDYQFLGDVEKCVQQINHARCANGVSSLLKVEIVNWFN